MSKIISLAQKMAIKYRSDEFFTDHDHKVFAFNRGSSLSIKAAEILITNFIATYGDEGAEKLIRVLKEKGFISNKVKVKKAA